MVTDKKAQEDRRKRSQYNKTRYPNILKRFQHFYFPTHWEDSQYMSDQCEVSLRGSNPAANLLLLTTLTFTFLLIMWSVLAEIDEVVRGEGQVIPSGEVKTIQNLEGGIVMDLLVKQGDIVDIDQPLLKIKNTSSAASYQDQKAQLYSIEVTISRLLAELDDNEMDVPTNIETDDDKEVVLNQIRLLNIRQDEFKSVLKTLQDQQTQQQGNLEALNSRLEHQQKNLKIANRELEITKPLFENKTVSEMEFLKQQTRVNTAHQEISETRIDIISAKNKLLEIQQRIKDHQLKYRKDLTNELIEARREKDRLNQALSASHDRVERTVVRSPVKGIVNRLMVHTIGGVIKPGMDLMDVVPLDETLLVKAKISPRDIAFIHPGQEVKVKFSAYDFATYGNLVGHIENITADTLKDNQSTPYYEILVRTETNHLEKNGKRLPIITGMVATVDITTQKKSVMDYILKPILRGS